MPLTKVNGQMLDGAITADSAGNVGIGTASPSTYSAKLAVVASSGAANQWLVGGSSAGAYAYFSNNAQSSSANTMQIGQGWASGTDNIGFLNTNGANPMLFATNGAERMRIDSNGRVMLGTASSIGNCMFSIQSYATGSTGLQGGRFSSNTAGKYYTWGPTSDALPYWIVYNESAVGVYIAPNGTSWNAGSDETTKDIIEPIDNAVNKIATLRTVIGKYKTDKEGTRRVFLIAQDVKKVLPEAVNIGPSGTLGLQYQDIIPLLVASVKELNAKVDAQAAEIVALKAAK